MSISIDMFMLVGRNWLKNQYISSFEQKKGFDAFNSHVNCWKVYNFLNCFEILPCVKTTDS